jgi:DtxR family manganese transport transcriptional regulator
MATRKAGEPGSELPDPDRQAAGFGRIRRDHRQEVSEDYVELIADLIDATGECRAVDLAGRLGVTAGTVTTQIAKLQREGLVRSAPYRAVFLTEAGRALAESCRERHRIVVDFLRSIGVSEAVAESDAEGIEHHVSRETLDAFARFSRSSRRG